MRRYTGLISPPLAMPCAYNSQRTLLALTRGARLGPYEILSALGAGGMGEVYRARDTRLKRDVAMKILSHHSNHDT